METSNTLTENKQNKTNITQEVQTTTEDNLADILSFENLSTMKASEQDFLELFTEITTEQQQEIIENCKAIIENRRSIPVFLNNISCQLASDDATLSYEANACIRFLESVAEGDKQYFSLLIKKMENWTQKKSEY